jgi:hypothetical protein
MHDPSWGLSPRDVGKGEALVLFHYVIRSYEEFVASREPKLPGVYAPYFRDVWEAAQAARAEASEDADPESKQDADSIKPKSEKEEAALKGFEEFESKYTFNIEAPVCSSLVDGGYLQQCCSAEPTSSS